MSLADVAHQTDTPPPEVGEPQLKLKQRVLSRYDSLERLAAPLQGTFREIADLCHPGAVVVSYRERSANTPAVNDDVVNSAALIARRILEAGLNSGMTSPNRPWMRLTTWDPLLARIPRVASWLQIVSDILLRSYTRSGFYQAAPQVYGSMGAFGHACMITEADPRTVMRCSVWPVGGFFVAQNDLGIVDTIFRKQQLTVSQVVRKFKREACSERVRKLWDQGRFDELIDVVRCVQPRDEYNLETGYNRDFPYASVWFELSDGDKEKVLLESGYREFPAAVPRWTTRNTDDVYGRGPGFDSLLDARGLQHTTRSGMQLLDAMKAPSLVGGPDVEQVYPLPGEVYSATQVGPQAGLQPIYAPHPTALQMVDAREQRQRAQVMQLWYADLWRALTDDTRDQRATAREIQERHEEKLQQLGPTLDRTITEFLNPFVERSFWIHLRAGMLPPTPKELGGSNLRVEYLSSMAIAMRLVGISSIERLSGFVGNLAAVVPSVVQVVNWDKVVRDYAERVVVNPDLLVPEEEVQAKREAQAQAAKTSQQIEQAPQAAKAAELLSKTDVGGDSALNRLLYSTGSAPGVPPVLPGSPPAGAAFGPGGAA